MNKELLDRILSGQASPQEEHRLAGLLRHDEEAAAWMTEDPRTVKINEEVTVDAFDQIGNYAFSKWQYSTDNGSTWTSFSTTAGTSASCAITGLSPNTTYQVKVRARKQSNQVYGTSAAVSVKTLGGAVVNSVSALTADAATVSISINVTVYEASYTNTLVIKNGSTAYLTISGLSWTKGTSNRTVTLTAAQRTTLLTAMAGRVQDGIMCTSTSSTNQYQLLAAALWRMAIRAPMGAFSKVTVTSA